MVKNEGFVGEYAIALSQRAMKQFENASLIKGRYHLSNDRFEEINNWIKQHVLSCLSFLIFSESENRQEGDCGDEFTAEIIKFLKENLDKRLTLNEIASHANYSPTHLSSKFKKASGYSPIEYFNHLKMQKACQLLRFTQKRINEIAAEIGIDDPYYFSRLFSKHLGISPSEFRDTKQVKNAAV